MKLLFAAVLCFAVPLGAQNASMAAKPPAAKPAGVQSPEAVQQLMPPSVFFSGQTATVQVRNSAVVRFDNGGLVLAGLVDTGGYSTSIREKYQIYLLADTPVEIAGKRFSPGAYGCGFVNGQFLVLDLGANEIFHSAAMKDGALQRPRPLQMVAGKAGEYRLYAGREYVALRQAK